MRTVRKLVLGETWTLPAGIALAVLIAVGLRAAAGADGWWREAGGFVLLALLVAAFAAALVARR
jgi:type IV secretory pathway VirB2 component (pilin)